MEYIIVLDRRDPHSHECAGRFWAGPADRILGRVIEAGDAMTARILAERLYMESVEEAKAALPCPCGHVEALDSLSLPVVDIRPALRS